ncbi:MAG: hypothetical protein HZB80_03305 [Deltaproteobacteria bacterium]|nr:hypothetical protein [Deltaproteobacteria bacterium]
MEALEIVMAIYKLNTDRGFDAPSPLPFLIAGQRISIVNHLFLAGQGLAEFTGPSRASRLAARNDRTKRLRFKKFSGWKFGKRQRV